MKGWISVIIWLALQPSTLWTQPLDTLLSPFHSIEEVYPLTDGTFILIGTGDNIVVEKRDYQARVIWSIPVVSSAKDYLIDFKFDTNSGDSVLQVLTANKSCDAYGGSPYKAFTINLSGMIVDSQFISFGMDYRGVFLLSGQTNKPRLAYIRDKKIILMESNRDTTELKLTWEHGDTTNADIIGIPKSVAICPNGDLLVTDGFFVLVFQLLNNKYEVVDVSFGGGSKAIHCLEDDYFISESPYGLELWNNHFPIASFQTAYYALRRIDWRNPILALQTSGYMEQDSIFFMTSKLELLHAEAIEDYHTETKAIQDGITFSVGSGNLYTDGGLLVSERQDNHEGPKYYDVELVNFEFGQYASASWYNYGGGYYLEIPEATVTIKNNCSFPIDQVNIFYSGRYSICHDTIWEKNISDLNLSPGETKSYTLKDIFVIQNYPATVWDRTCLFALMPDQHYDDYFDDNELCKKVEFLPSASFSTDFPVHHFPSIIQDEIRFVAPENFEFDLTIYAYSGIPVFSSHANTSSNYTVDARLLPSGLYIFQYTLSSTGQQYLEKILKY